MRSLQFLDVAAILSVLAVPGASAQSNFTTLYTFQPAGHYPQLPNGVVAGNGVFYGSTEGGGAHGLGSVFELQPPSKSAGTWKERVLYSFTGQNGDGSSPWIPFVGPHGVLYGTTVSGGSSGYGTVFALKPPAGGPAGAGEWTESVLHSFTYGNEDGFEPTGNLVVGADGTLYGTTQLGGVFGRGIVFALRPPSAPGGAWTETVLFSFGAQYSDGANPDSLAIGPDGVLYGTTLDVDAVTGGTVFELTPPAVPEGAWTETVLHVFTGGADGCYPFYAPVVARDGSLYGTTYGTIIIGEYPGVVGDGTVFKLTPPGTAGGTWTNTVLYAFDGGSWGPMSPLLIRDGAIYGTAGDIYSLLGGAVFKLQEGGALSVLYQFGAEDVPYGTIAMDRSGSLYGTTGGAFANFRVAGTAYRLDQ